MNTATDSKKATTEPIPGCNPELSAKLRAYCAAHHDVHDRAFAVNDVLSRRPGSPEVRLRYDRGNGDLTGWLPSSRHLDYMAKGWTAVAMSTTDGEHAKAV